VEDSLGQARQALGRETDLLTLRSALQQFNNHLAQNPGEQPSEPAQARQQKVQFLGLDEGEQNEIQGTTYTLLDGRYLEQCFLLRDSAQTLLGGLGPESPVPLLERATAAFRWTVRQVRLEEPGYETFQAAPPTFVLRRGWGSALERGLVFLELLRQIGPPEQLQGCLVYCPGDKDAPRLWACGVVVEGGPIHLFDPRLGLPIPGPEGKGVATLGQMKDLQVLGQLTVNDSHRYDVTAEQAARADLRLVCPLSALSPRMQLLQDRLLGPTFRVRLVVSPLDDLERLKKSARAELGRDMVVRAWQEQVPKKTREGEAPVELDGAGLLRRFLAAEEGGSDPGLVRAGGGIALPRELQFYQSLLRWTTIPFPFNDPNRFPPFSELGGRIHHAFRKPVLDSIYDPGKPRNLILRGRFTKATPMLVEEQRALRDLLSQRQKAGNLSRDLAEWLDQVTPLYAQQQRARNNPAQLAVINQEIESKWGNAPALTLVFAAAMAGPRSAQLSYLLGLCKQDQAEIQQARTGTTADKAEIANSWLDALSAWDRFLDEHPKDPASGAARQLRARALAGLDRREEAAAAWENLAPPLTPLEQVAGLYQAGQIRKK
jgi:hypothetical protein